MTETAALETALNTLKAHGGTPKDLGLGEGAHTAKDVVKACAKYLRGIGHNACADGLLRMEWFDGASA